MIVDTHCHTSDRWYEPVEVLLEQLARNSVDVGVLVQYSGMFDNSYQMECVRRHPDRLASVVIVDTHAPSAPEALAQLASQGAVGVRLRPGTRSPGADPLAIWRTASELRLPVTSLGSESDFLDPEFADLLAEFEDLPIVIEHLGTRGKTGTSFPIEEARKVYALSRFPNVFMKFHGLGEFAHRSPDRTAREPFTLPIRHHLREAYETFGSERLMWGSDYPPVSAREGYARSLNLPRTELERYGANDQEITDMFGHNAARFYGLGVAAAAAQATTS